MKATSRILLNGLLASLVSYQVASGAEEKKGNNGTEAAPLGMAVRFELFVKDTRVTVDFYSRVLSFECNATDGPCITARCGSVRIGICDQATLPKTHHFSPEALQAHKGVGTEIVLEVENFGSFYQRVVTSGYTIHEKVAKRPWGLRDFRLVDPDGYYLRITEKSPTAN